MITKSCKVLLNGLFVVGSTVGVRGFAQSPSHLYELPNSESRSISPENPTGGKGAGAKAIEGFGKTAARNLGAGWKVSPAIVINSNRTTTLADVEGAGVIRHIWLTPAVQPPATWRSLILRVFWDDEKEPSVEVPLGDFFAMGLGEFAQINSQTVAVNPRSGFNAYWEMPFRRHARVTLENRSKAEAVLYYQIDYSAEKVAKSAGYLHAQFRNVLRTEGATPYVILDGVKGNGQYVGTYMTYGVRHPGWWGEGEIKFFIDADLAFPTIAGTGTEDYFGGAYNFVNGTTKSYQEYSGLYTGLVQVLRAEDSPDPIRFGMYRWHITDPIRFRSNLKVTIQMLGWKEDADWEYDPLHEHVSSVAYWYQTEPHQSFPLLPPVDELETR